MSTRVPAVSWITGTLVLKMTPVPALVLAVVAYLVRGKY